MNYLTQIYSMRGQIITLLGEHIQLTAMAVGLAVLVGIPLGVIISRFIRLSKPILGAANVIQAIPSMALLGFAIPIFGIGVVPSVLAVALYALLPIIKNTYTGMTNIPRETLEAAEGIGMKKWEALFRVQFPMAMPYIMAGVRISAVNTVGFMTMAAYVGAGGLGYLVYSGIRTLNNYQTLAGAIPACLLALFIDYFFGIIEKLVTPTGLQLLSNSSVKEIKKQNRRRLIAFLLICASILALFAFSIVTKEEEADIVVASKDYTEQIILGSMIADVIEGNTNLTVKREMALGGSEICFAAMKRGEIDIFPEYSGTMYTLLLKHDPISDKQLVYDTIQKELEADYNIIALESMNFNNTFTLAVRADTAEKYGLKTLSDLAKYSQDFILGAEIEFFDRKDGLLGLNETYGFHFKSELSVVSSNRYTAIENGSCDVINAYSTDGLLKKFELVCMEDDKNFFVPYFATPLLRREIYERYPQIVPYLLALGASLNDDIMMELNYKVDELQISPEKVARDYVIEQGLISESLPAIAR